VEALLSLNILPQVLKDEQHFYTVTIPELDIVFLTKSSYSLGAEKEILDIFPSQDLAPSYFPYNNTLLDGYIGPEPSLECYEHILNQEEDMSTIEVWLNTRRRQRKSDSWEKKKELLSHIKCKSKILLHTAINLKKTALQMQIDSIPSNLLETCSAEKPVLFCPMTPPLCSIASFSFCVFRFFFLKEDLYTIPCDTGIFNHKSSRGEQEYVMYKTHMLQDEEVHSSWTSNNQARLKVMFPDIYSKKERFAGFYNGEFEHILLKII
jgi:hypothetical protein